MIEEIKRRIAERRLALLRELATGLAACNAEVEVFAAMERCLAAKHQDMPFVLLDLADGKAEARLAAASGIGLNHAAAPARVDLSAGHLAIWPLAEALVDPMVIPLQALSDRVGPLPKGPWDRAPTQALIQPIPGRMQDGPAGAVVVGANPYRPLDEDFGTFVGLFVGQSGAGLANARAYEAERRRAEALAEIDRAKTTFFSNISHEFRTPLTLILGPWKTCWLARAIPLAPAGKKST